MPQPARHSTALSSRGAKSDGKLYAERLKRYSSLPTCSELLFDCGPKPQRFDCFMKTLLLLRHAKSSWKETQLADHDRPLNKRGRHDAPRIGNLIERKNLNPNLIVSSTALRARSTAQVVAESCAHAEPIHEIRDLYLAGPQTYIETARCFPNQFERVLMVGHNPGISQLLWRLTGSDEDFPTAALAQIEIPIDDWSDLAETIRGRLIQFWRPREL